MRAHALRQQKEEETGRRYRGIHTLKFRFFSCVALTAAIYIVVIILLNVLFFQRYYLIEKKHNLTEIYQHINSCYAGDVTVLEDELKHLEKNNNIRISIFNQYDQAIYDTIYQHDRSGTRNFVIEDPLGQAIYVYNSEELKKKAIRSPACRILTDKSRILRCSASCKTAIRSCCAFRPQH